MRDRLQEVEEILSEKVAECSELEDKVETIRQEIEARDFTIKEITEKNKMLTQDQQMLTARFLEEKNKWVEVMNEANSVYEGSRKFSSMGGGKATLEAMQDYH